MSAESPEGAREIPPKPFITKAHMEWLKFRLEHMQFWYNSDFGFLKVKLHPDDIKKLLEVCVALITPTEDAKDLWEKHFFIVVGHIHEKWNNGRERVHENYDRLHISYLHLGYILKEIDNICQRCHLQAHQPPPAPSLTRPKYYDPYDSNLDDSFSFKAFEFLKNEISASFATCPKIKSHLSNVTGYLAKFVNEKIYSPTEALAELTGELKRTRHIEERKFFFEHKDNQVIDDVQDLFSRLEETLTRERKFQTA